MNQRVRIPLRHFFATPPGSCPYLPERVERKVVTLLSGEDPSGLHDALSLAGFRRSQDLAYRPACEGCSACVSVRVLARRFTPSRSLRRLAARNRDLRASVIEARANTEQFELFRDYLESRHAEGGMADMNFGDYRSMVEDSPVRTHLVEFRDGADTLVGACLTDRMSDGLSLVYSFFDNDQPGRGLGNYMILWHIERVRRLGLGHVYLGYWIEESSRMAYKSRFRPLERLTAEGWQPLLPPSP